jgi:hypothetical protein
MRGLPPPASLPPMPRRSGGGFSRPGGIDELSTPEMASRVIEAIQQRLMTVLQVAEDSLENNPNRSALRGF